MQRVKPIRQADPERFDVGDTVEFDPGKVGVIRAIQGFELMLEQIVGTSFSEPAEAP